MAEMGILIRTGREATGRSEQKTFVYLSRQDRINRTCHRATGDKKLTFAEPPTWQTWSPACLTSRRARSTLAIDLTVCGWTLSRTLLVAAWAARRVNLAI